ncbi:MAG: hypothetical protein Tsb0020_25030 [Haliangiales bacterium]
MSDASSHPHAQVRTRIFLAEAHPGATPWLQEALAESYDIERVERGEELLRRLAREPGHAVIIGHKLADDMSPDAVLSALRGAHEGANGADSAATNGEDNPGNGAARPGSMAHLPVFMLAPAEKYSDDERVFYILSRELAADDVRTLVGSACGHSPAPNANGAASARSGHSAQAERGADTAEHRGGDRARPDGDSDSDDDKDKGKESARAALVEATQLQRVLEVARQLAAQRDLEGASDVAVRAMLTLLDAERAYCLFHDHDSGALWSESEEHPFDGVATQGLSGFVARTRVPVHARAGSDPRYCRAIDDPTGSGDEHIAAYPVLGHDGGVHAVLVAVRSAQEGEFGPSARREMALIAEHSAPLFELLARHLESKATLEAATPESIFRREALDAYTSWQEPGDVLRVSPRWLSRVYWLLLAMCVTALAYATLGTVNEYSTGPAVIRMVGRTDVTSTAAGTIAAVQVVPGQRVAAGDILVRLHDADAMAEFRRSETEFESQLRNLLRSPGDTSLQQSVASLRAQRERALSQVEERRLRAPHAGTVSDVRIRAGQALSPGQLVMSLIDEQADLTAIILLPGSDRPLIETGMPVRLELRGYRYAYQDLTISRVADEVIGPAEASRFLGARIGDSIELSGSVVLVRARLPSPTFVVDDVAYSYHDGMQGIAEVRVRARTILENLIPALEKL